MSCAIATDDRKAHTVIRREAPHVRVLGTTALLRQWAEASHIAPESLRSVLTDVRERGRYSEVTWWVSHCVAAT